MISKELQATLNLALQEAASRRHEYLTLEHLLLSLTKEKTGLKVIENCNGRVTELQQELDDFLNTKLERLREGTQRTPEPSTALERVLSRAAMQAQSSGQSTIDGGNVIAAMFQEKNSHAVYLLEKQGITRLDVLNYISHGISKVGARDDGFEPTAPGGDDEADGRRSRDPLAAFTINLIERAKQNKIDNLIGRDSEIQRTIQVLCRRRKNNPISSAIQALEKRLLPKGLP